MTARPLRSQTRTTESPVREATADEVEGWNALVAAGGGSVWQAHEYAEVKRQTRYRPVYLMVGDRPVSVLERRVPVLGRLWYVPGGPATEGLDDLTDLIDGLVAFARTRGVFVVKIEPRLRRTQQVVDALTARGYHVANPIVPNSTAVVVDLTGTADEVMARFSTRARRWIRRAERDGVIVERVPATDENCRIMYDLLAQTADARFGIRSAEYCRTYWQDYEKSGNGQLFLARFQGEVVAGVFAKKLGTAAFYKDGGSVRKREGSTENGLGAHGVGHAVQWAVMEWAREVGCDRYDLGDVPPAAQIDDPTHHYHGLGKFKLSFDKEIVEYVGALDVPVGWGYRVWQAGLEREMRRFSLLVRRDAYY
ncbi:lipid II:glycine glycyltransferase FemX [Rhodococcus sp. NPDC003318]|uniref:lipid II:glycine glycyltransferase FemX n=1 Tax=Rhodococcus sp. NPDC003318 TaxID=3364503 RepID=UPI00369D76A4